MLQNNVNTAAKESEESSLTDSQIQDLFSWVVHNTVPEGQPDDFIPTEGLQELTSFTAEGPDFISVWLDETGWPVAATAPMDTFFRVMHREAC
ncbi:hypothetical protein [Mangrovibacter phragmitis]|uniref:hypothetical protein n=1 Tax=Mangrovibacter phragmitis TaxID=1691903 RepID=UPI00336AAE3E